MQTFDRHGRDGRKRRVPSSTTRLLAGIAVVALLAVAASPSARADGGAGGDNPGSGGADSTASAGGDGTVGGSSGSLGDGGGGGGAGTTGGTGGAGGAATPPPVSGGAGGLGATAAGGNGAAGGGGVISGGTFSGGGGGGGGAHGSVTNTLNNGSTLRGGNGGVGGTGSSGGGGGSGGYGAVVTGSGSNANTGSLLGGNGGAGGLAAGIDGPGGAGSGGSGGIGLMFSAASGSFSNSTAGVVSGGSGGDGGAGIAGANGGDGAAGGVGIVGSGLAITNQGSISGGNGGFGGGGTVVGVDGAGGVGITGSSLSITNSGAISGGSGGSGQAEAIIFTGGTNTLELQSGYSITGNVVAFSAADTLALGGSADTSFDVSTIGAGARYQNFGVFQKTGTSTWTLTSTTTAVTPWTISQGTLSVSSDGALGDTSGGLTLTGGTLQWGAGFNLSPARSITLGAGGGTFDTNGFTSAIGVDIAGSGGLTKNGAGTLILGAPNDYTGGTTVNAGTLQVVSGASLASTGAITVNGGTLDFDGNAQTVASISGAGGSISLGPGGSTNGLTVNQSVNTSYNGNISGDGSFTKTGGGTLVLNGTNTYTGPTTINSGTLEIGDASHTGASLSSNVIVGASGVLMGHGTLSGGVTNTAGGVVAPGGSIGTLSVGSYTQGASSTLRIEVSPTAASKLNVTGAASLNGTLALVYDPGVYSSATFDILHAGSITGTFATMNAAGLPNGITQAIIYSGGTDVDLVLTGSGSLVVRPTNDTIFSSLNSGALLGGQQANTMLLGHLSDSHSGTGSETIETALAGTTPTQLAFIGGATHLSDAVAQLPDTMAQLGGWFRAIGSFAGLSSSSVPGVDTQGGGFMAGIDRSIDENVTVGIAGGYSHTNLSQHDEENGMLDTPRIAAYGSYVMGPWAFDATVGYAYDRVSEKRPLNGIGVASANYDAHEATGAAQASYRFDYAGVSVMPNAGLTYVHLFNNGLEEGGAGGFDLDVSHRNADSLRPFIGVSASEPITTASGMRLVPEGDIRYSHELFATAPSLISVGGGNFAVNGITPSHDLLTIGGGITAAMSDRLALFADYHATLPTGNYWQQTISAGARYKF